MYSIQDDHYNYVDYRIYDLDDTYNNRKGHVHHRLEVSMAIEGEGHYWIEDKCYTIHPGDIFIIGNGISHGIYLTEGQNLKNMVFHFEPCFIWSGITDQMNRHYLDAFLNQTDDFQHKIDTSTYIYGDIKELMLKMSKEFKAKEMDHDLIIKSYLMTMLVLLNRNYAKYLDMEEDRMKQRINYRRFQEVIDYIHSCYNQNIRLSQLADMVHLESTYFSKLFKELNGLSPISYINHVRINKAMDIMKVDNQITLEEVSWQCGFKSYSNFKRIFKNIRNESPSFYRKRVDLGNR